MENEAIFFSPKLECKAAPTSTVNRDEREFIVDSGASMHMMSKMELTPEEMETIRVSRLPTTVITAIGSINTTEMASLRARFGHVRHCPTPRRHSSSVTSGK